MSRYRVECPFCIVAMRERMEYTCSYPVDLLAVRNIGPTIASKAIGTIAFGLPAPAHKKLTESRQRPEGDNKEQSLYRKTKTAPTRLESRGGFYFCSLVASLAYMALKSCAIFWWMFWQSIHLRHSAVHVTIPFVIGIVLVHILQEVPLRRRCIALVNDTIKLVTHTTVG